MDYTQTLTHNYSQVNDLIRFFILFTVILGGFSNLANGVTLCYEDQAFPPYMEGQDQVPSSNRGLLIEIIDNAFNDLEQAIEYQRRPWLRCQQLVTKGENDGIIAMIKNPQRTKDYAFPNEQYYLFRAQYPIFFNKQLHNSQTINKLALTPEHYRTVHEQFKFGLSSPTGYVAQQKLRRYDMLSPHNYTLEQGLRQVFLKRLDGYVVERVIGQRALKRLKLTKSVQASDNEFMSSLLFVAFNQDFYAENSELIDSFWQRLAAHRQLLELRLGVKSVSN